MNLIFEIIGWILISLGVFAVFSGSVGILRFKGFFTRLHPAGMVDSFGAPMVLFGLMFIDGFSITSLKLGLLIVLILLTSPTACHALAKAAFHAAKQQKDS